MTVGFPGMHVKPLFPSRRTTTFPCASVSTMRANLAISGGPADIARAILDCTDPGPSTEDAVRNNPHKIITPLILSYPFRGEQESLLVIEKRASTQGGEGC